MEKNIVVDIFNGPMDVVMKAILLIMRWKDKENIYGQQIKSMKEVGKTIQCMDMAILNGQMAGIILEIINMVKNKGMENFIGQMELFIKAIGIKVKSMAMV